MILIIQTIIPLALLITDLWNITITKNFGDYGNVHNQDYTSSPSLLDYSLSPICNTTDPNYPNYNYTINLTVTDILGCTNNLSKSIDIVCEPVADFIYEDICFGAPHNATYQFIDNSNVTATSYSWNFGDLIQDQIIHPQQFHQPIHSQE